MKFNEFNNGDTNTMKNMTSKEKKQAFLDACMDKFESDSNGDHILTIDQLKDVASTFGMKYAPQWIVKNPANKVGKGLFKLPALGEIVSVHASRLVQAAEQYEPAPQTQKIENTETKTEAGYVVSSLTGNIVPEKDPNFVTFGDYSSVKSIIASKKFYPIFITGLSGNGKTLGVTQACAEKKREMIRVNITIETDEDDLLGGYRLETVKLFGKMVLLLRQWKEVLYYFLMRLTSLLTRLCVYNLYLKATACLLRRLTSSLNLLSVLLLLQQRILKVKVLKTVSLSGLMFLMRRF